MGTFRTLLPQKTIALKAGLGWIGKSDLLVTEEYGSAIRLSSVLTDAEIDVTHNIVMSKCGKCSNCVQNCPGHALTGKAWTPETDRDEIVDPVKCREAARKQSYEKFEIKVSLCGKCFYSCPWTQRYLRRNNK